MKKIIFLLLAVIICLDVFSQNAYDAVYLKNGGVFKGIVIEQVLGEYLRIKISDGSVYTCNMVDVESIRKEFSGDNNGIAGMNTSQSLNQKTILKKRPFYFEIFGAYSFSWLSGFNDATGFDGSMKSSYQAGLGFTYAFNSNVGLESGVSFLIPAGNEYSKIDSYNSTNGKIDLSYVQIPLLVKYDFMNTMNLPKGQSVGIKSGLQMGFNTSASDNGTTLNFSSLYTAYYNTKFDANKNIDWVVGLYGYLGNSGVSMNFNMGLNGVIKSVDNDKNFKNRNISFSYSYRF
jgi:hypothetical protein